MDNLYWASAVEVWELEGETLLPYSKPVIPLRQNILDSDYEYFGKSYNSLMVIAKL